ncbi:hypothetical protein DPMN_165603 [Dreissena polymorpha]|uniref:Uncharacterized protein n=1 Tax=Dreissena polymorpha TaxID=45954 RepID=A0A9D4EV60_DREPO|nr:hypothetical protein DPMN_165603 [Dreissena polymorpha]
MNVASRVLTRFYKSHICPNPWWSNIIGTNLLTKFHDDQTINVASRVLTRKNAPLPWRAYIIRTNLLTKFHRDRTINPYKKNAPPHGDIIGTNLQTKFHDDWKVNVASRVLTRKNAPPLGSNVFQPTGIVFKLVQDINGINLLTKMLTRKNAPPLGSHVFQANVTIFTLIQDNIETNLLTKFHEDWTINVASGVSTRQMLTAHDVQCTTDNGQKAITKAHHS